MDINFLRAVKTKSGWTLEEFTKSTENLSGNVSVASYKTLLRSGLNFFSSI